ncbi:nucleoside-diphosphate sugar epimerase/dehydratase [Alitiscatomonas aceti]|uniref:Polysaccharide biosynthesis protein n=4 Tax=Alitiscatomonas aceti TaxID=2981724 RepID=A0ABT2V2N7_9FIRM|nr:nucleoside-diphosphate sugar epimerase/dehydratase [Alitiscatomonas aceti]MCU6801148.1 polysaccharide biosynthesis protein [Alitiscatomonas aceti]
MYEFLEKYLPRDKRVRMGILMAADVLALCLASFLGLFVRFDLNISKIPPEYARAALEFLPYYILASLVIFFLARMYSTMWSVAGVREALHVVAACGLASLVQIAGMMLLQLSVPRSFFLVSFAALCAEELGIRLSYRVVISLFGNHSKKAAKRIMIVGAGTSGSVILKEMTTSSLVNGCVVCFVDDDKNKAGKFLNGVPVAGNRNDIPRLAEEYKIDEIYIAIPSASAKERKAIIEICRDTGCQVKILPGIYQLINGEVSIAKLRNVEIEDLLGRDPIRVNLDEIMGYVSGKVVLVTGGGGSIGSELCRQVASHNPKQLIIFDIYENNAYDIQLELKEKYPDLDLVVLIGSVRNTHRIETVFEKYRPDIVYHAAAHKHVPLMEDSPNEAIKNNVFGTYKTAKAADKYGTKRFVLISTDKAVNPTNIMGASKRMCEMVVQMMNARSKTDFVAVRFGNVLGSNGSVIPLFKKQIEQGGPVTVTHPDIIRYFMTIPEAVSLVLQAGAYAKGGEIFVLDMGEPMKILDLAKNLIRLSGYTPDVDIPIVFTGLRPGEKLYEELLMNEEGMQDTPNKLIHIGKPIEFDMERFEEQLEELYVTANEDGDGIREDVMRIVGTYHPAEA